MCRSCIARYFVNFRLTRELLILRKLGLEHFAEKCVYKQQEAPLEPMADTPNFNDNVTLQSMSHPDRNAPSSQSINALQKHSSWLEQADKSQGNRASNDVLELLDGIDDDFDFLSHSSSQPADPTNVLPLLRQSSNTQNERFGENQGKVLTQDQALSARHKHFGLLKELDLGNDDEIVNNFMLGTREEANLSVSVDQPILGSTPLDQALSVNSVQNLIDEGVVRKRKSFVDF